MPENRRSSTRHDVDLEGSLTVKGQARETRIHNLALGGAFCTLDERLGMGERAQLRFRLPSYEGVIEVGATVRWTAEGGCGVQFDGLRAKEVYALTKYLEAL